MKPYRMSTSSTGLPSALLRLVKDGWSERRLQADYAAAAREWERSGEADVWACVDADGLTGPEPTGPPSAS